MLLLFDVAEDNRQTLSVDYQGALALGYAAGVACAALKDAAKSRVSEFADTCRALLSSASAGKLAAYRFKEEIAREVSSADPAELALIDREAIARGLTRDELISEIAVKATAYRQTALLIEALEVEAKAAITAIPDDAADIETQIQTVLEAAKAQAETAFAEALALINGGS